MRGLRILADELIPNVEELFGGFGELRLLSGRSITPDSVADVDVLLVRSVTQVNVRLLEGSPVRFVASATIGTDHIDLPWLDRQGIVFAHAPGSNARGVVEYVCVAIARWAACRGLDPGELSLGIVGAGHVGGLLARLTEGWLKRVVCVDPLRFPEGPGLDDILGEVDILSFHVPLITDGAQATRHMLTPERLAQCRRGGLVINTSRGAVIERTLCQQMAGEGVAWVYDVFEGEPEVDRQAVSDALLATPHIAGHTRLGKARGVVAIYQAFCRWYGQQEDQALMKSLLRPCPEKWRWPDHGSLDVLGDLTGLSETSSRFRQQVATHAESERGKVFDALRREYRPRPEFSEICLENVPNDQQWLMKKLGFTLV